MHAISDLILLSVNSEINFDYADDFEDYDDDFEQGKMRERVDAAAFAEILFKACCSCISLFYWERAPRFPNQDNSSSFFLKAHCKKQALHYILNRASENMQISFGSYFEPNFSPHLTLQLFIRPLVQALKSCPASEAPWFSAALLPQGRSRLTTGDSHKCRLVAAPPTSRTAIGGHPTVASCVMLSEQLRYFNLVNHRDFKNLCIVQLNTANAIIAMIG